MKGQILFLVAVFAVFTACTRRQAHAQPRFWNERLNIEEGRDAEKCSDLQVRANSELAQSTENFRLSKSQAPTLEVEARTHSSVHVRGWERPDYSVEVCKFAVAGSRSEAEQRLRSIAVSRTGARLSVTGPDADRHWEAVFFVHAPKDAALNLDSGNAPVEATAVSGKRTIHATNGPLALERCSGTIDAETVTGPISMSGGSGDVHLRAFNGPISLKLADPVWNGSQLEARTDNGPLSVVLPSGFRSGLRVETSGHAPISCRADSCLNARTQGGRLFPRLIQTGSGDVVRLSTHYGPVLVSNSGCRARTI